MSGTGRKITKRACDGCKIRKIKCSGLQPCDGCAAVRISCTYLKHPSTRGPRKLRPSTLQEIAQTQQQSQQKTTSAPPKETVIQPKKTASPPRISITRNETNQRISTASLVPQLCVYRLRMFPVWPVVKVEEVIASLQRNEEDIETYALANAVGAATVAQLKLTPSTFGGDAVTGEMMESECQRARSLIKSRLNTTALRTAFFLHVYHENQEAGGVNSLLYLREAITIGQMMGLHKESSYINLTPEEQQIRRRILWLLFVTERGVAMLHKLPVILKPNISFPSMDRDDETFILPAFQKLVNLFWIFDQSGAFDILQDSDADSFGFGALEAPSRSCLDLLQRRLREVPVEGESINDVQTADICVTRQWMRAVLWRFSVNHGLMSSMSNDQVTSLSYPFQIAKEFLGVISQLPRSAIEAHGQAMELKIYEIASSVTDAIAKSALTSRQSFWGSSSSIDRPGEILNQLHQILSSCRGGNKTLLSMLCNKITEVQSEQMLLIEPSAQIVEEEDSPEQWQVDSMNNDLNYSMGVGIASMSSAEAFTDQADPLSMSNYEDQPANTAPSERSSLPTSSLSPDIQGVSDLSHQQSQQHSQQQPQSQHSFIPFPSWQFQDSSLADLQQQNYHHLATNASSQDVDDINRLMASAGSLWDVGMSIGLDGLGGGGSEAVEGWN